MSSILTVGGLYEALDLFITNNRDARNTTIRWLADSLIGSMRLAQRVQNDKLTPDDKISLKGFRLLEIENKKHLLTADLRELEIEAERIKAE